MDSSQELQRLLSQFRTNSDAAEQLMNLYRPVLRLMAEQMIGPGLRRREDASDIVQRTEVEAYAAFAQFNGGSEAELSAWLKQILRRNVANLVRDNRAAKRDVRREVYPDADNGSVSVTWMQPAGRGMSPSQLVIRAEVALNLALALGKLPEDQRTAVTMRHLDGCDIEEIAQTMAKTTPAVAGLVRRGLQALRLQMVGDTNWL